MKKFFSVFLYTFLLLGVINTNDSSASYCEVNTKLFFGNGMYNNQMDADSSLIELEDRLKSNQNFSEIMWDFELSYNHNEEIYSLFEVFRQRMGDQASSYWRWLGAFENAPDWFAAAAQSVAASFDFAEALVDEDLNQHIQRYQGLLMEGNRVLIVAHSQGNLYANAAYSNLAAKELPMESFGIVSVANPASRVAGDGPYFTLMNDLVIAGVRAIFPNTLPGNVMNGGNDSDWAHHSFVDAYLNGDQSGPLILNTVLSETEALAWPVPQVGKGPISVTMTWGEQPDVDLHVFEPGGSHVYYASPSGQAGYLDHDDSRSYGPEHYYVDSCDMLEPGRYGVAVNYYRGEGPETAHVQIQAGDIIRDYSAYLFMAFGSTGNSRAWPVANIDVIEDPEQGYVFKVNGF